MRTKAENFRNAPKPNFDLYVISFICTNFEAFTTFSCTIVQPDKDRRFDWLISGPSKAVLDRQKGVLDGEIEGLLQ